MASNKLVFKKVRAKNFRSVGNMGMELDFLASMTTLISSENNGSGKSTLAIWAIFFALFGKPYNPKSKIGGLVNSKSNKDCVVELEFETRGQPWLVKRGYKPGLLEIYQDGKLIENEAANGDMQAYLESVIGMNEKAFCSIVALGVDRFVPFVQMTAPERRNFVEQMLDLIVISSMNEKTKERVKSIRKEIEQYNYDIGILESKYAGHHRTLQILEAKQQQKVSESDSEIESLNQEAQKLVRMINLADSKIHDLEEQWVADSQQKLTAVNNMINKFKFRLDEIKKGADNVAALHDCPTCKQGVTDEHKDMIKAAAEVEMGKLTEPMQKLEEQRINAQAVVDKNLELNAEMTKIKGVKLQMETKLDGIYNSIKNIRVKMADNNDEVQISSEKIEVDRISTEIDIKNVDLGQIRIQEAEHMQLLGILKDDGIKANIVSQYIPFLNTTINNILDQLNLYIQINIDPEFNVSMFAPDRKGQTIENLSTGQLRRVDLAVLLAWREIAKNKASVDCNVLVLDEILENLSASGVEEFMEMWEIVGKETNLIVISQRAAEFDQYFERSIRYALKDDMTVEI